MIDAHEAERITALPSPADIRAQLDRLGWTQAQAAEYLRIDPRTFRRYVQDPESAGYAPMPFASFALLRLTRKAR